MCGIFGIFSRQHTPHELNDLNNRSIETMKLRGPDESGGVTGDDFGLAHTRLSVISPADGRQPMKSAKSGCLIVFNGYISNFETMRLELLIRGYPFKTETDTEVILALYDMYGSSCLNMLEGMFAFCIYDPSEKKFFIARDAMGIKPLFYMFEDDVFCFASDPRVFIDAGLLAFQENTNCLTEFLVFGSVSGSSTLIHNVKKLMPGSSMEYSQKNGLSFSTYWSPNSLDNYGNKADNEILDDFKSLFLTNTKSWLGSDVPISLLLSGGIDSSLLATLAKKTGINIDFFSASFDGARFEDEIADARSVCEKINAKLNVAKIPIEDLNTQLQYLSKSSTEPLHNANSITFDRLIWAAKTYGGSKVVLTGDGADELFAGYPRHKYFADVFEKTGDPRSIAVANNHVAFPRLELFTDDKKYLESERFKIAENLKAKTPLGKVLEFDQRVFLNPYLERMDKISMLHSIESRPPMLDRKIVDFVNAMPERLKMGGPTGASVGWTKYPLRLMLAQNSMKKIAWQKQKKHFSFPASQLLDNGNSLFQIFNDFISLKSEIGKHFDINGVIGLLNSHRSVSEARDHGNTLFRLLGLELWLRSFKK